MIEADDSEDPPLVEADAAPEENDHDPDEVPVKNRKVITQPYDLVVQSLTDQIKGETLFLRPISDRPSFQRNYVWNDKLASRLIESILLNVPVPPCYLSQNEDFELDVIDGQQRMYSIYRFLDNQFGLTDLEVLEEFNGQRFFELPVKSRRQISTHTIRCVLVTNESHPEIKFDVFERLNTNTVPLNAQELRNCIYRGSLNAYLGSAVLYEPWLKILGKKVPDKRMRDDELVLRFFSFQIQGVQTYRTPLKHWLNDMAKQGRKYSQEKIATLDQIWRTAVDNSLVWFEPKECYRRPGARPLNKALFDLVAYSASRVDQNKASEVKGQLRERYENLIKDEEFSDLISRAVDHTRRTKRRFEIWNQHIGELLEA